MRRELIGYRNCLIWLSKHFPLDGMCIQLIGDALSAVHVVAKGGSQQMDDDGNLPVLEVGIARRLLLHTLLYMIAHVTDFEFLWEFRSCFQQIRNSQEFRNWDMTQNNR